MHFAYKIKCIIAVIFFIRTKILRHAMIIFVVNLKVLVSYQQQMARL